MFRSITVILSGNITATILIMIRNLLIARLISLENYGIASTFLLALAIVEMFSALGLQKQMVQAKNGDDPHFQASLQFFSVLRGVLNAVVLFLIATPLARFFGAPEVAWAYQMIALIPLLYGFMHFDVERLSRDMKFGPTALCTLVPALGGLLMVWPLHHIFDDYRILLYSLLAQVVLSIVTSHVTAKRRYRLAIDGGIMWESIRFGWPLLLNGVLMFAILYGERTIVGGELGLEALALFSMGFSLALAPALVMSKSATSFFLPQLSKIEATDGFADLSMSAVQAHILLGNFLMVSIALLGGPFIHAILSEKYAAAIPLLTWLGVMQALRVWKVGSATVALSRAHTENAIVTNLVRVMILPLGWYVINQGGSLLTLIWIGIAGEFIGFVLGLALALWRLSLPVSPLIIPTCISIALLALGGLHAQRQEDNWMPDPVTGIGLVVVLVISFLVMRNLRRYLTRRT